MLDAHSNGQLGPVVSALVIVGLSEDPYNHPLRQQIGIAVEGGGMGSSLSKAGLAGLEIVGNQVIGFPMRDCVRVVGGSSGGAPNALYFVGGRSVYGMHTYTHGFFTGENFLRSPIKTKPPFINFRNLVDYFNGTSGIVNLKYITDKMIASGFQYSDLDPQATKLIMMSTRVDPKLAASPEARAHVIKDFPTIQRATEGVLQACHIPILSGRQPYSRDGELYLDGGISQHMPRKMVVDYLHQQGAETTYTLCFSSMPMNYSTPKLPFYERMALKIYPHLLKDPKLVNLWRSRYARAHDERLKLHQGHYSQGTDLAQIIAPPASGIYIKIVEQKTTTIEQAQKQTLLETLKAFGITDPQVQERVYANIPRTQYEVPV